MTDLASLPESVRAALRDEPVPDWRAPTLATLTEKRFSDPDWIFERKFDGMRCLAFRDGDRVRLLSRNRKPLNGTYPELVDALAAQHTTRFVVDGEVVAFEGRRTSFARLQGRLGITDPTVSRASRDPGLLLRLRPVASRRQVHRRRAADLAETICCAAPLTSTDPLRNTPHRIEDGIAAYRRACERGDEGVIAKLADSKYDGRRSPNWLKFKCVRDQEFVVGGYTSPKGSRIELGALLIGYYDDGDLVYAGKVGTGFDEATLRSLHERLSGIEAGRNAVHPRAGPPARGALGAPRVGGPDRVQRVDTRRQAAPPALPGLRTDKEPGDVVRETR